MPKLTTTRPSERSRAETTAERLLNYVRDKKLPVKNLHVVIEQPLYEQMQMKALQEGSKLSEITRRLWIDYLQKGE